MRGGPLWEDGSRSWAVLSDRLGAQGRNLVGVYIGRIAPGPPGWPEDAAPAGEPVPGTEAAVLWRPTRGKGEPASTRR